MRVAGVERPTFHKPRIEITQPALQFVRDESLVDPRR